MKKKHLTKKQAYKLLEDQYGDYNGDYNISYLCQCLHYELKDEFQKIWKEQLNTKQYLSIGAYVGESVDLYSDSDFPRIRSLTRLLTACMFVEDNYK